MNPEEFHDDAGSASFQFAHRNGSMVCARPGAHYAIITAPEPLPALDDAINVSGSTANFRTISAPPLAAEPPLLCGPAQVTEPPPERDSPPAP